MQGSKERVKAAINHQLTDRIPRGELCIDDALVKQNLNSERVGFEERAAFVENLGLDLVTLAPHYAAAPEIPGKISDLLPDLERWVSETSYFTFVLLDGAFGWGARLFDYVDFLMLPKRSPSSFQALIEKVEKLNRELIAGFIDAGVDGIIIADDIAHQRGLMVSPATLREYLFPSLARQVELIRRHLPAFFHSDGQYAEVISDLINCGFQGLQCLEGGAGMDPLKLKSLHPQLCLWGTLEMSDLQQASDPDYLEKLLSRISALASQKGFILGTTCGLFSGIDLHALSAIYEKLSDRNYI